MNGATLTRSAEKGSSSTQNGGNSWYVVDNNGGTMTVNDGKIVNTSGYSSLIRNLSATFHMHGGTLENTFIVLKNDDNGIVNMDGGTITTTGTEGCAIQNWGSLDLTGGELNAPDGLPALYALAWDDRYQSEASVLGDVKINGGVRLEIDNYYINDYNQGVRSEVPTMTISQAAVSGKVEVSLKGELTIKGGHFAKGAAVSTQGQLTINDGNSRQRSRWGTIRARSRFPAAPTR